MLLTGAKSLLTSNGSLTDKLGMAMVEFAIRMV